LGAFGEKLRKQREQRGIELDAISNTTKISTRMLRALEEEHFDQLPGGVFNKGFVRAYARHVGLDEQEAIADYLAALNGSQLPQENLPDPRTPAVNRAESAVATVKVPAQIREENRRQETRPVSVSTPPEPLATPIERFPKKYPAGVLAEAPETHSIPIPWEKLAVALVLLAVVLAFLGYRRHRQQIAAAPVIASTRTPSSTVTDHAISADQPGAKSSMGTNSSTASTPATISSAGKPSAASSTSLDSPRDSISDSTTRNPSEDETNSSTAASFSTTHASQPAAPKTASTFTLQIRATETSWISITADGNPVASETLIAPAGTSVRAAHEIVVKTGNAAGITFFLKGKTIPTEGAEGEVKTFTFDSTGLHEPSTPTQTPTTTP
jgi:cytoskeletal protein RodZ